MTGPEYGMLYSETEIASFMHTAALVDAYLNDEPNMVENGKMVLLASVLSNLGCDLSYIEMEES